MSVLKTIRRLNIPLDWPTMRLAWEGISGKRLVTREEVGRFAEEQIDTCTPEELPYVAELATAKLDETVTEALTALAPEAKWVQFPLSMRKVFGLYYSECVSRGRCVLIGPEIGICTQAKSPAAFWKLACALLDERLSTLPRDPVNGPAELSGFWLELGPPPGHPHIFQGVGNSLTPAEYYTLSNLEKLVSTQREWLSRKVEELRRAETA